MENREIWKEIKEFPNYLVSNQGRIMNNYSDKIKTLSVNKQGIVHVNMIHPKNGGQARRSVAVLVAKAFLDKPYREDFDTPINLDGDRTNNSVENLMWRPRWFAIKYHTQQKAQSKFDRYGAIIGYDTKTVYNTIRHCCRTHGLHENVVYLSILNNDVAFCAPEQYGRYS